MQMYFIFRYQWMELCLHSSTGQYQRQENSSTPALTLLLTPSVNEATKRIITGTACAHLLLVARSVWITRREMEVQNTAKITLVSREPWYLHMTIMSNPQIILIDILFRIGLLNENAHDSLQLWVSCLRTHQADLIDILFIIFQNFQAGTSKHILRIPIVQHDDYKNKEFFVLLKNPIPANLVDLGEPSLTKVTIIDDDGMFDYSLTCRWPVVITCIYSSTF